MSGAPPGERIRDPHIWVDADACPTVIKDILFRAAERVGLMLTLVANHAVRTPPSQYLRSVQVAHGFDEADHYITERVSPQDLVITADIPLAAEVVSRGATALNPRGSLYTEANVRERLAIRDINEELRGMGATRGGPPALGKRERQAFAGELDRWLATRR